LSLVAVARWKLVAGVEAPGFREGTYDWREPPGSAANTGARPKKDGGKRSGITAALEVQDLGNALATRWDDDAHLVCYVVRDASGSPLRAQPRVNKGGAAWMREQGYELAAEVFVADVDNPQHGPWTPVLRAAFDEARARHRMLSTAGVYVTAHGWRIVQPLVRAMPVEAFESALRAWLLELNANGIAADLACADWTRLFRLPLVRRDGRQQNGEVFTERMRPIDPPATTSARSGRAARGKPRRPDGVRVAADLPAAWVDRIAPIAAALTYGGHEGERHFVVLALAGALLGRRVPAEYVPAIVDASMRAARWNADVEAKTAEDTVHRWAAGAAVSGARWLRERAPHVLDAVDAVTCAAPAPPASETPSDVEPLDVALERLRGVLRTAPSGVTLVKAQCGLGKTRAAIEIAIERSKAEHRTPGEHVRAPMHSKTAIVVPTTKLAIQVARDIASAGVDVVRYFGVLSVLGADGRPVCQYHDAGRALAAGGQSIPWELCEGRRKERCDRADACSAYGGREGPDVARVAVGPHSMLAELEGWCGKTGLLVIDEPPAALETEILRVEDLKAAFGQLRRFEPRYAAAMAPALDLVAAWLPSALDYVGPLAKATGVFSRPDLEDAAFEATGAQGWVEAARSAFDMDHKGGHAPALKRQEFIAARQFPAYARALGEASRVLGALWVALNVDGAVVRVEGRGVDSEGAPRAALIVVWPNEQLAGALLRDGAVVALDASADLHAPVVKKIVGYEPPLHVFAAPDGAQILRTLALDTGATRSNWLPRGKLDGERVSAAVRRVVDWALEAPCPGGLGIISFAPVELALRAARGEDVSAAWSKTGVPLGCLDEARRVIVPELSRLGALRVEFGHYGAMRGLDGWKDLDALVTLGDPWPNIGDVQHEVDYLELGVGWQERVESLARAELEQAQGRLRTVHRTRSGRQLHVGHVAPAGWASWETRARRRASEGRPANVAGAAASEVAELVGLAGGPVEAARQLGCDRRSLTRYAVGTRSAPADVVAGLRRLVETRLQMGPKGLM
jgi:hypothetical protein